MLKLVNLDYNRYNYYYYLFFSYNVLFFRSLIFSGKKLRAFNLFLNLKYNLKLEESFDPFFIFLVSMMKLSPEFTLSALKLSGIIYWLPIPITLKKKITLSVKWAVKLLRTKNNRRKLDVIVKALKSSIYNKGILLLEKKSFYSKGLMNRHLLKYFS